MKISTDYIISGIICAIIIIGVLAFGFFYLGWNSFLDNVNLFQESGTITTAIPAPQVNTQEYTNKLSIIFVYDGYTDKKDALLAVALFKETLKIVEPYSSMQETIMTKTFSTDGSYCTLQNISGKKRIKCADKVFDGIQKLGILHYKAVILSPINFAPNSELARGGNSTIYISTLKGKLTSDQFKRWMGIVFSQELGHSLGLSYEYFTYKPSAFQETGSASIPNCAPDTAAAKEWWKGYSNIGVPVPDGIGYFKGCSGGDDFIYPEQNTLMSDDVRKQSYGKVSEDYLSGMISCFYANKDSYVSSLGTKTCAEFKVKYPNL